MPKTKAKQPIQPKPQTGFNLDPDKVEQYLLTGEARGSLEDYFGAEAYAHMRDLAQEASSRSVRGGARVWFLPGIMGSTLAKDGVLFDDVLWIDPFEIALGGLTQLKLSGATPYRANGVIQLAYLKLKLRLKIAGFNADYFPFDWRLSLDDLGGQLAAFIRQDPATEVSLVVHSMGGLVARAALKAVGKKVTKLIMLGTPNYGSFAPVEVLRGVYDVVKKVAFVDAIPGHDAQMLAGQVFNTFPGLYQMLPAPEKFTTLDLYKAKTWPKSGPQPVASILTGVKPVIDKLAPADARFYLIAGVNQTTVTDMRMEGDEFLYTLSPDGDGTVPLAFAQLADIPASQTYFIEESHGSLPNNGTVESAVVDLLSTGTTNVLPNVRPATRIAPQEVPESALLAQTKRAAGGEQLGSADYRHLLDAVAAPPVVDRAGAAMTAAAAAGTPAGTGGTGGIQNLQGVTIGRRLQRRLEITLAYGSITEADAPAYVLACSAM